MKSESALCIVESNWHQILSSYFLKCAGTSLFAKVRIQKLNDYASLDALSSLQDCVHLLGLHPLEILKV